MKEYNANEYVKLYHEMQKAWEELLFASRDLFVIGSPHPAYVKFTEAELKVRRYYFDWNSSGTMINKDTISDTYKLTNE